MNTVSTKTAILYLVVLVFTNIRACCLHKRSDFRNDEN